MSFSVYTFLWMLVHVQVHVTITIIRIQNSSITPKRLPCALSLLRALSPDFHPREKLTLRIKLRLLLLSFFFSFSTPWKCYLLLGFKLSLLSINLRIHASSLFHSLNNIHIYLLEFFPSPSYPVCLELCLTLPPS